MRIACGLALLAGCMFMMAAGAVPAWAALVDLPLTQCIYGFPDVEPECVVDPRLDGANAVAVSPDGRDVYATAGNVSALLQFRRDATTGNLTFAACWADDSFGSFGAPCTQLPAGTAMQYPRALAISPDGASVYVAAGLQNNNEGLSRFSRDTTTGALTFEECFADDSSDQNCGGGGHIVPSLGGNTFDLAVTPDGKDLIVAVRGLDQALTMFRRSTSDGSLSAPSCFSNGSPNTCTTQLPMSGPASVSVSPDGRSVYAAIEGDKAVAHYARDPSTGALAYRSCIAQTNVPATPTAACTLAPPASTLDSLTSVAVTPDGGSLIVGAVNALSTWTRDTSATPTNGSLTFGQCFEGQSLGAGDPCTIVSFWASGGTLGVQDVAVAPDSSSVFAIAYANYTLSSFDRNTATGDLTFHTCIAASTGPQCPLLIATPNAFIQPYALALSPNGADIYSVSIANHGALLHWGGTTSPPSPTATTTPSPVTTPVPTETTTPSPVTTRVPVAKSKCDAGKILCVAKKQACLLAVHSKAEKKGVQVGATAVQKCADAFDGGTKGFVKGCIGKLEHKEDPQKPETLCAVTGDLLGLEAKVDAFVADVVSEVDPNFPAVQPPNDCNAGKKACMWKNVSCLLKAQLNAVKKNVPVDDEAVRKCKEKFDGGSKPEKGCIAKLEAKQHPDKSKTLCSVQHADIAALEAKVDAFVADVVSEIRNVP